LHLSGCGFDGVNPVANHQLADHKRTNCKPNGIPVAHHPLAHCKSDRIPVANKVPHWVSDPVAHHQIAHREPNGGTNGVAL
jgi:hypothetical protein